MDIKERVEIAIFIKYYGNLLTDKQRKVIEMYVDNNLSYAEVAIELGISRQAVKAMMDSAYNVLTGYEKELQFVARDDKIKKILKDNKPNMVQKILQILED